MFMKKIFLLLFLFCLASCIRSNDDGTTRNLPAITSEGKNTFGCKIDGVTFLPKTNGGFFSFKLPSLSAKYFKERYSVDGNQLNYFFRILAYNEFTNKDISIELAKSPEPLIEGKSYPIVLKQDGSFFAKYSFSTSTKDKNYDNVYIHERHEYNTSAEHYGELRIIKIDEEKRIVSGTFSFDCIDNDDNSITEIRDGRFDLKYEISGY